MRFVIDYRKLNDHTIKDEYPMPSMKDLIDNLSGSKYFSCMDILSTYWHIPMEEKSIEKTTFEIPKGRNMNVIWLKDFAGHTTEIY